MLNYEMDIKLFLKACQICLTPQWLVENCKIKQIFEINVSLLHKTIYRYQINFKRQPVSKSTENYQYFPANLQIFFQP